MPKLCPQRIVGEKPTIWGRGRKKAQHVWGRALNSFLQRAKCFKKYFLTFHPVVPRPHSEQLCKRKERSWPVQGPLPPPPPRAPGCPSPGRAAGLPTAGAAVGNPQRVPRGIRAFNICLGAGGGSGSRGGLAEGAGKARGDPGARRALGPRPPDSCPSNLVSGGRRWTHLALTFDGTQEGRGRRKRRELGARAGGWEGDYAPKAEKQGWRKGWGCPGRGHLPRPRPEETRVATRKRNGKRPAL